MSNNTLSRTLATIFFLPAFALPVATAANIYVYPGDDLNAKIASAQGGDTVFIRPGTYDKVHMTNRHFTASAPLLIRAMGSNTDIVIRCSNNIYTEALIIDNCRYVLFDYMTFTGGTRVVEIKNSQNIIVKNCIVRDSRQEGIHILNSSYVDIRGGKVYNTGTVASVAKWGEGIYVGNGTTSDICSRIWIEYVEIYNTGYGEGVEFKPGVRESTIRGCTIRNISPGTWDQSNEGAIVVNGFDYDTFVLTAAQNNWVENNHVYNVAAGYVGKNRGIVIFGSGVTVKGNQVHNCINEGILASNWLNKGFTNRIYNNWVYSCGGGNVVIQSGVKVLTTDPGNNPFSRQSWYN